MLEYVVVMLVGVVLIVMGVLNFLGNISLIHSYHYKRVKEEDKGVFCKLMGVGTIIIGACITIGGLLSLIAYKTANASLEITSYVISISGLVIGVAFFLYAMIKYNKGIF